MNTFHKKSRFLRDGVTSVEMALVLPAFLALLFGCLEFSRVSLVRNQTANAAYQAARYAMASGTTDDQVTAKAIEVLNLYGVDKATTTVRFEDENGVAVTSPSQASTVSVDLEVPYTLVFFPVGNTPIVIQSEATLRTNKHDEFDEGP